MKDIESGKACLKEREGEREMWPTICLCASSLPAMQDTPRQIYLFISADKPSFNAIKFIQYLANI